ncbi:FecR domain-containing protein [Herminiimonas glaciei]|uniref:FecR domain-containing protein n=1 Tax=Herminiimonas glaciei TaxID=523788 RepID=A0ABW2IDI0_9BURK
MAEAHGMQRLRKPDAIDPRILDEAAEWLMQLSAGARVEDHRACERWSQSSPEHARAWARAQLLLNKLGGLPPSLAMPTLNRTPDAGRRAALTKLAAILALAPASWGIWSVLQAQDWMADYSTAVGERRVMHLADNTELTLNTATAVDVRFTATQRNVRLRSGEILVQTAHEAAAVYRPFSVNTLQGQMEALGTRFSVRLDGDTTHLAVLEGAVRITPDRAGTGAQQVLRAGQQASFTDKAVAGVTDADDAVLAWTQGMLVADKMRLADFAAELSRYRSGIVHVDPAVADVRVSGAYPVGDTDQELAMLVSTYPVDAVTRMRGRWITLLAR